MARVMEKYSYGGNISTSKHLMHRNIFNYIYILKSFLLIKLIEMLINYASYYFICPFSLWVCELKKNQNRGQQMIMFLPSQEHAVLEL